jgi:hypothetical protein
MNSIEEFTFIIFIAVVLITAMVLLEWVCDKLGGNGR